MSSDKNRPSKGTPGRILAFDFGERRIGCAEGGELGGELQLVRAFVNGAVEFIADLEGEIFESRT